MSYRSTKFLVVYHLKVVIYLNRFTSKYFVGLSEFLKFIIMFMCKRRRSTQVPKNMVACIRIFIFWKICENPSIEVTRNVNTLAVYWDIATFSSWVCKCESYLRLVLFTCFSIVIILLQLINLDYFETKTRLWSIGTWFKCEMGKFCVHL